MASAVAGKLRDKLKERLSSNTSDAKNAENNEVTEVSAKSDSEVLPAPVPVSEEEKDSVKSKLGIYLYETICTSDDALIMYLQNGRVGQGQRRLT